MSYEYSLADCDVLDKDQLAIYRDKRTEWLHWLQGDPDHAVWTQITGMLWNDAVFRMANEARRLSRLAGYESSARNWSLAQFMDQGFVATQTLSIRKLMERAAKDPAKQVISLRRTLDDIKAHRHLITREHYVAHDGLPYDPSDGAKAQMERALRRCGNGVHSEWLPTTGPEAWSVSQMAHERFDKLSGAKPGQRERGDIVCESVFGKIDAMLVDSGWQDIARFGNKFIAHAADEHSRGSLLRAKSGFSLNKLAHCHKGICKAATAIHSSILWEGARGLVPVPQFNHFDNLSAPWLSAEDVVTLSKTWDAHIEEVESWAEGDPLQ